MYTIIVLKPTVHSCFLTASYGQLQLYTNLNTYVATLPVSLEKKSLSLKLSSVISTGDQLPTRRS